MVCRYVNLIFTVFLFQPSEVCFIESALVDLSVSMRSLESDVFCFILNILKILNFAQKGMSNKACLPQHQSVKFEDCSIGLGVPDLMVRNSVLVILNKEEGRK